MTNILVTQLCNLKCHYCFAEDFMTSNNISQKEMGLGVFILCLKHLHYNGRKTVRLLGGEPMLYSHLTQAIQLSLKGGFSILLFSNLSMSPELIKKTFSILDRMSCKHITVNLNLNQESFYQGNELDNIYANIEYLHKKGVHIVASSILEYDMNLTFIKSFLQHTSINKFILKPLNGDKNLMDTSKKSFATLVYSIAKELYREYDLFISCGLSEDILSDTEKKEIRWRFGIDLLFGCDAAQGKYSIEIDGNIHTCYPLSHKFNTYNIKSLYQETNDQILELLYSVVNLRLNRKYCLAN